jgi:hypothetical protein
MSPPLSLQVGFWTCTVIAIVAVLRRLFALGHPSQTAPPQLATFDATFASHTALTLAHILPAMVERSAVLFFNSLFLFSLARAYWYMRLGDPLRKMRWLSRTIAILLGIATTRPIVGIFFATRGWTHLEPSQFFGIAFWIGFSINTIVVELWLRSGTPIL